jgi:hypothetical protein
MVEEAETSEILSLPVPIAPALALRRQFDLPLDSHKSSVIWVRLKRRLAAIPATTIPSAVHAQFS